MWWLNVQCKRIPKNGCSYRKRAPPNGHARSPFQLWNFYRLEFRDFFSVQSSFSSVIQKPLHFPIPSRLFTLFRSLFLPFPSCPPSCPFLFCYGCSGLEKRLSSPSGSRRTRRPKAFWCIFILNCRTRRNFSCQWCWWHFINWPTQAGDPLRIQL